MVASRFTRAIDTKQPLRYHVRMAERVFTMRLEEKQNRSVERFAKKSAPSGSRPNKTQAIRVLIDRGLEAVTRGERGSSAPKTARRA